MSHHYQKPEIISLLQNGVSKEKLDFTIVRETMYKYSKKAEEKFWSNPILAFYFILFALSQDGLQYTKKKLVNKNTSKEGNARQRKAEKKARQLEE